MLIKTTAHQKAGGGDGDVRTTSPHPQQPATTRHPSTEV